jgi:serine/threonine protein kinase
MTEETTPNEQPSFDVPSLEAMNAYLPQFKFEKLAACGGMGAVYKAYQESLDRNVAVKILPPEFGAQKEFTDRFKVEARAAGWPLPEWMTARSRRCGPSVARPAARNSPSRAFRNSKLRNRAARSPVPGQFDRSIRRVLPVRETRLWAFHRM